MTAHRLRPVPATGTSPHMALPHEALRAHHILPGRDLHAAAVSRRLIGTKLIDWGVPDPPREALQQIVTEFVTNAVQHAPADEISVRMLYVPYVVSLTVATPGGTPLHLTARQAGDDAERGRGLALVEALATDWGCLPAPEAGVWALLNLYRPPLHERRVRAIEASAPATWQEPPTEPGQEAVGTAELEALVDAGGFWRLTPPWWPRTFDARRPSAQTLRAVQAGLSRLIS
ncbi:ATP-binding protein [Streptomyces sp. NPDC006530]|uniref:ATP-binding protein n=1 Tax=Streptomyces sp. NPDC006530 TaxID=3364750 RepID=UPI003695E8CA